MKPRENASISLCPLYGWIRFLKIMPSRLDSIRKSGLTFAPEAGSQRMRDIINKNITEEDLFSTMEQVFSQGYTSVKLYFMIGLPFETYEDLDGICRTGQER